MVVQFSEKRHQPSAKAAGRLESQTHQPLKEQGSVFLYLASFGNKLARKPTEVVDGSSSSIDVMLVPQRRVSVRVELSLRCSEDNKGHASLTVTLSELLGSANFML